MRQREGEETRTGTQTDRQTDRGINWPQLASCRLALKVYHLLCPTRLVHSSIRHEPAGCTIVTHSVHTLSYPHQSIHTYSKPSSQQDSKTARQDEGNPMNDFLRRAGRQEIRKRCKKEQHRPASQPAKPTGHPAKQKTDRQTPRPSSLTPRRHVTPSQAIHRACL
mmetsp:Transcript_6893/g.16704  ORF Transcript_6893/g.16704 Transcript_6893/m.16704 type:complete len:165 (+) Transcript_6893:1130-1624(+)